MLELLVYIFGTGIYIVAWIGLITSWSYYITEDNSKNHLKLGLSAGLALMTGLGLVTAVYGEYFIFCLAMCIIGLCLILYITGFDDGDDKAKAEGRLEKKAQKAN
jgi:O-antigen/teichoic acid export membrane protein